MQGMLGFFFDIFSLVIPERIQTCTDSSIKESDQERQRSAEEVGDLRKQLSKAAAEACLHWLALAKCLIVRDALDGKDKDGKHREAYVWHTMVPDALLKSWGIDMVDVLCLVCMYVFFMFFPGYHVHLRACPNVH